MLFLDSFFRLLYKFFEGAVRVDAGAGILCQLPALLIPNIGRIKGPCGTWAGLDGMNQALFFFIKKYAELIGSCFDIKSTVFFPAIPGHKRFRHQVQKMSNPVPFIFLKENAAFSIAAGATHFAIKGFHKKVS